MTTTADHRTLEPLDVFVGAWSMATSFAPNPADAPRARTTFEWLPGRRFLIQRWTVALVALGMLCVRAGRGGGDGAMGGIVVGVDDSPGARKALAWAVGEARLRGAALRVVHVHKREEWAGPVYFPSQHAAPTAPLEAAGEPSRMELAGVLHAQEVLREAAYARAEALLDELLGEVGVAGVQVESTVVQERHPADVLRELSSEAELLVVGSRGRGGFGELLLGSVTHALVLHATCPVVVVPFRP